MLKDTKSLGNNKAPACESRGFVLKKKVCFLTHLHCSYWTEDLLRSTYGFFDVKWAYYF